MIGGKVSYLELRRDLKKSLLPQHCRQSGLLKTSSDLGTFFFFFFFLLLFLAALVLHCCMRAFSSCGERGLLFVAVRRLFIAAASLVAERGL